MGILCDGDAAKSLLSAAILSDVPADHVPVPAAPAQLGGPLQLSLRLVHLPALLADAPPQVLDHAQDLAAPHHLVEPASPGQQQVAPQSSHLLQHTLAQALPDLLSRPRDPLDLQPVAPPRQPQVALRYAAQPQQHPAGHPALPVRDAAPAAPPTAGQRLPRTQVVPGLTLQPALTAAQDLHRPRPLRDQSRALPAHNLLPAKPPRSFLSVDLPARLPYQVVTVACTARLTRMSLASTRPSYQSTSFSLRSPSLYYTISTSSHTVAFR